MPFSEKFWKFCNRNMVLITCVPLIASVHWAWLKVQDIPYLVPPEEKLKEFPIVTIAKKLGNKFSNEILHSDHKDGTGEAPK